MTRLRSGVENVLQWTVIILMAAMVTNALWQVATRFILRNPSSFTEEVARYLLIWVGLLGAAHASGKRIHLAIDLLPETVKGRNRHLLLVLVEICIFVFALLVLVIGGTRLVQLTLVLGQTSAALQIPLGYVYLVLPLTGVLMMFFAAVHAVDELRWARISGHDGEAP